MRVVQMLVAALIVGALAACSGGASSLTPSAGHSQQTPTSPTAPLSEGGLPIG